MKCFSATRKRPECLKICLSCWKQFNAKKDKQIYCSSHCVWKASQTNAVKKIRQKTCLDKYGNKSYMWSKTGQTVRESAMLKKYGTKSPLKIKEFLNKYKETYKSHKEENIKKTQQAIFKKYGVTNISQLKRIQEKKENTCLENYWVLHPNQSPEILLKALLTRSKSYNKWRIPIKSNLNILFGDKIKNLWYIVEYEIPVKTKIYDLCLDKKIMVEISPTRSHASLNPVRDINVKSKEYHRNKMINAGMRCLTKFDWDDDDKFIELLRKDKKSIYARKCNIKELDYNVARDFLNLYHLQNSTRKNKHDIYLWLYYNNDLVLVMTFWLPRENKKYDYELLRLCTKHWYNVLWGANKLFKYFIKTYNPKWVISYCDESKFTWNVYTQMWFSYQWSSIGLHWCYCGLSEQKKILLEEKYWITINKELSKSKLHFTDNFVRRYWFDILLGKNFWYHGKGSSNNALLQEFWYRGVYDCWQATYARWKKK